MSEREWLQQVDVRPGEPWPALPWESGHPLRRERIDTRKEVWRHTVYGGVFPLSAIRKALEDHFGADGEDHAGVRQQKGDTAVFAITVDSDGVLLEGGTAFSTCAWATGRVRDPGPNTPGWLDGFEETESQCGQAISMLTQHHIPYTRTPSEPGGAVPLLPDPPAAAPGAPGTRSGDWRSLIREILSSAAVGALGALIGDMGAGAIAGALRPVARRVGGARAGRQPDGIAASTPPGPPAGVAPEPTHSSEPTAEPEDDAQEPGRPLELPDLVAFAAHVADLCGVGDLLSPASIRIHSQRVRRKKDGSLPDPDPAFLNSLLPEDLERVASAESHGKALTAYLTDPAAVRARDRIDVRDHPEVVLEGVAPEATPLGRWPAPTEHPLALSQQFAVNRIIAELSGGAGLFSVNGPPGTGKTTMLRDLIASIVVERAVHLAALTRAADGFSGRVEWKADGYTRSVARLRPALTGHEIVVASSNNGAVQNITTELPALDALGEEWLGEASYFLDQAVSLLDGAPAWGAVAAPLGKSEKRKEFMSRWWWGEKPKQDSRGRARNPRGDSGNGQTPSGTSNGMQSLLQRLERGESLCDPPAGVRFPTRGNGPLPVPEGTAAVDGWAAAKAAFLDALRQAEALRADRAGVAHAMRDLGRLDASLDSAELSERLAREDEEGARQAAADARTDLRHASVAYEEARDRAERHRRGRPGGLLGALGAGRAFAEWQDRDRWCQSEVERTFLAYGAAGSLARATDRVLAEVTEVRRHARLQLGLAQAAADGARRALEQARAQWGEHFPEGWEHLGDTQRELSSPWSDEEFCAARTRVFLAALNLHRAFVAANARTVRLNLLLLKEVLAGMAPPDVALVVWQSLFLVMPVVSTTFASCGRLFGPLEQESLGWVLIDEAGQAAPQAAVGALWRARRAVLVGDPLQLEPVVSLPVSVQERLRQAYGVDEEWLPSRTSAQRVADRTNRWGTTVESRQPDGEIDPVWVGAPLRVHRRCERTIFELSNDIAYEGLMVYGTREKPFPGPDFCPECVAEARSGCLTCAYPLSCWVDVIPGETVGKWVPEEGAALERMVTKLHHVWGVELDRIRVLSPFREVVAGCARTVRGMHLGDSASASAFLKDHIGTVHTMQGNESDVVILVLGTHPREGAHARAWAAEKPNLLNVAVSRAKRRLFVIGHRESWSKEPYFDTLADPTRLPLRAWAGGQGAGR
ncbi:DNA helicase [Streptomyces aquilus]|uniref:DNA helicase n=1 Tax=Streptomyces aquilus TaxID=2548456 RepID=A0A3S9HY53_9ACTN|nr:ATP-binding protein [Streptomyces aquilus]AZP17012.1 DNA helicase [Streptomyces aquilus]